MESECLYTAYMLENLSDLPIRILRGAERIGAVGRSFQPDPALPAQTDMLEGAAPASIRITDDHLCFGLVRDGSDGISYLIGPSLRFPMSHAHAVHYLHSRGEPADRWRELQDYFNGMPHYDIRDFAKMICAFCWFVHGTRITLAELMLPGDLTQVVAGTEGGRKGSDEEEPPYHNTYEYEKEILSLVEFGQPETLLERFAASPNTGVAGTVALDEIRQEKNILIGFAALVSRAAIRGGLPVETAFALVDRYDQQAELLDDYMALTRLMMSLIIDFARQVKAIRHPASSAKIVQQVVTCIAGHIDGKITTAEIARHLNTERTYLCKRFKRMTGQSINECITAMKMEEAKRLLATTDKKLSGIADYLAFSSQSYFQNVFKKATGMTPLAYRKRASLG